jgi:hypothetical protein
MIEPPPKSTTTVAASESTRKQVWARPPVPKASPDPTIVIFMQLS